jgi:hypothetical protein
LIAISDIPRARTAAIQCAHLAHVLLLPGVIGFQLGRVESSLEGQTEFGLIGFDDEERTQLHEAAFGPVAVHMPMPNSAPNGRIRNRWNKLTDASFFDDPVEQTATRVGNREAQGYRPDAPSIQKDAALAIDDAREVRRRRWREDVRVASTTISAAHLAKHRAEARGTFRVSESAHNEWRLAQFAQSGVARDVRTALAPHAKIGVALTRAELPNSRWNNVE